MVKSALAVLMTLLASSLVACGGDDGSAEPASAGAGAEGGNPGGDPGDGDAGPPDLGDFGVPLPDWADAVAVDDSGPLTVVQFIVPLEQQTATAAFYDDWVGGQEEEYLRTDSAGGAVTLQSDTGPGEHKTIIAILSPLEGDDFVTVTLTRGLLG